MTTRPRRRVWFRIAVLVLGSLAMLGIWSTMGRTALNELEGNPAASLTYPGSVLIRKGGQDGGSGVDGRIPATTTRQLGSVDPLERILAFYRREMASSGWATGGGSSVVGSGIERQICVWHKDGVVVRLSFWKPERWIEEHPGKVNYPTIYEVVLLEGEPTRNEVACADPNI